MYPITDAVVAEIAYRQALLTRDYRRGSAKGGRRWRRSRAAGRNQLS